MMIWSAVLAIAAAIWTVTAVVAVSATLVTVSNEKQDQLVAKPLGSLCDTLNGVSSSIGENPPLVDEILTRCNPASQGVAVSRIYPRS